MSAKSSIIRFGYLEHRVFLAPNGKKKHSAVCKFCTTMITEYSGVTSGFTRHMKLHGSKYTEYLKTGKVIFREYDELQLSNSNAAVQDSPPILPHPYNTTTRQKDDVTVKDLAVGCCLPIPLENNHFQNIMKIEPRSPSNAVVSDNGDEDGCWDNVNGTECDEEIRENQNTQSVHQPEYYHTQAASSIHTPSASPFSINAPLARCTRKAADNESAEPYPSSISASLIPPSAQSPSSVSNMYAPRRKRKADEVDQLMLSVLSSAQRSHVGLLGQVAQPSSSDEAGLVGEMVAVTLRRLSPYKRAMAKVKIQQLLFDIEFGEQQKV